MSGSVLSSAVGSSPLSAILSFAAACPGQWKLANPTVAPSPRVGLAMTYDPGSRRTILFGGETTPGAFQNDTWSYDGSTWTQLAPTRVPPPGAGAGLVADTGRGVLLMYGGADLSGGPAIDQTWQFQGATWSRVLTTRTPGGLVGHCMAYDIARSRVVVYGGMASGAVPVGSSQTWEFDGTNWTQVSTANDPGPLALSAMCYSRTLSKVLLYGGFDPASGTPSTTTWAYDGADWSPMPVSNPQGQVVGAQMTFDTDRGVCVLYGGLAFSPTTWVFDGAAWTPEPGSGASSPVAFGLAFDEAHSGAVLFGGIDPLAQVPLSATWHYGAWTETLFGTGCPGSFGVPSLRAAVGAHIGRTFTTTLTNLVPAATAAIRITGFSPLSPTIDLSSFGLPGCTLFASIDDVGIVPAAGGVSIGSVGVPAASFLVGGSFYYCGVSLDSVNAFGAVLSNTVRGTIGW